MPSDASSDHGVEQTLTHDCPQQGRVTLSARWLDDAEALRAECDDCQSAVYADRSGQESHTVGLTVP